MESVGTQGDLRPSAMTRETNKQASNLTLGWALTLEATHCAHGF